MSGFTDGAFGGVTSVVRCGDEGPTVTLGAELQCTGVMCSVDMQLLFRLTELDVISIIDKRKQKCFVHPLRYEES